MKNLSADFVKSAFSIKDIPKNNFHHIAFTGRSNVGKSSLMNILMKKKIARTSSTPGKTRELNFFLINKKLYFVDMPGYGYAKVSHSEQDKWKVLLEAYFQSSSRPSLTILIIDARHALTTLDNQMYEFLCFYKKNFIIVLSKSDKLSKSNLLRTKQLAEKKYPLASKIVTFSAKTKAGQNNLYSFFSDSHYF